MRTLPLFLLNSKKHFLVFLFTFFFLSGCDSLVSSIALGTFVDSPVEGLEYKTDTLTGKTTQNGQFQYLPGETVVFSIGNIHFPAVKAGEKVTPLSVFNVDELDNLSVVNMLRLLQSLDSDANPSNGISISQKTLDAASNINVDFNSTRFESQVASLIQNSGSPYTQLIDSKDAIQHFRGALPYRSADISGNWGLSGLRTPKKGTLNSNDFALNLNKAIVSLDNVISLSPLQNNPVSQTPNFSLLAEISDLSLKKEGGVRGEIIEEGELFDFAYLGVSKDLFLGYRSINTHQELSLSVKVAQEYSSRDLEGVWRRFSLRTPNNNNADPGQYGYSVEDQSINIEGQASIQTLASENGASGPEFSPYPYLFNQINFFPVLNYDDNTLVMNASKTVMINPVFSVENNQFAIMLKKAQSYNQSDLTGIWFGGSISTPQINQNHGQLFDADIIRFVIDSKGRLTATDILLAKTLELNGFSLMINKAGEITPSPPIGGKSYWGMDATKSMILVLTLSDDNAQKLTILIKQAEL